ncbi:MAG: hypothetical protein GC181_10275 [Bacteroidetes bacterium]|nr:hypothetical protein [Bacteroidota bacterium]
MLSSLWALVVTLGLTIPYYYIFNTLFDLGFQSMQSDGYLITTDFYSWAVVSLFFSMASAIAAIPVFQKRFLKLRFDEYIAYTNARYRFNSGRVGKMLMSFLFVVGLLILILNSNHYAHFGTSKIEISDFFQLNTSHYTYDDIIDIKSVKNKISPNGKRVLQPHFIIEFSDSYKWSTMQNSTKDYAKDSVMVEFVLQKTGLRLQHLEYDLTQ